MTLRSHILQLLATTVVAASIACGGTKVQDLDEAPVGSEVIVERSDGSRPDWVVDPPKDKDGMKFFSGGEEGFTDYALCLRMAKAEAMQEMGESVMSVWSSLLQASEVGGKDRLDPVVDAMCAWWQSRDARPIGPPSRALGCWQVVAVEGAAPGSGGPHPARRRW